MATTEEATCSTTTIRKRKSMDESDSSSESSISQELKRTRSDSSDCVHGGSSMHDSSPSKSSKDSTPSPSKAESSSGCDDTHSLTPIEDWTSNWTEGTLNRLQITSDTTSRFSVSSLFSDYFLPGLKPFTFVFDGIPSVETSVARVEEMVKNCIKFLNIDKTPLEMLNAKDITEIDCAEAYNLMFTKQSHRKMLNRQINSWITPAAGSQDNSYLNWFGQMFYIHGQRFTQQLINMCLAHKMHGTIKESMFEMLFQDFLGMFGLLSIKQDHGATMKIANAKVTSIPDIVLPHFKDSDTDSLNILAVCEVKRDFERTDISSTVGTRSGKKKDSGISRHLNDRLLGQHGGELLVYLPLTQTHSLLGMIVQRTNVTFSYLRCSEDQLKKIQAGNPSRSLDIIYSQSYNFLKADDRKDLMNAFLTLGVLQMIPYK